MAESGARAGPLAEDRADHGDRNRDLRAAEEIGQRGWGLDAAERPPPARIEGAHHLQQVWIDRSQAVEGIDRDGEEADEGDDRELRPDPESEPDDEDGCDHDDGHDL